MIGFLIILTYGAYTVLQEEDDGCGACVEGPPMRAQEAYVEEIELARQDLYEVAVVHTNPLVLDLRADTRPREFKVTIPHGRVRPRAGESQSVVDAGAQIGMKLRCSGGGVRCAPLSSERQNVLSKGDQATWVWEVSAQRPGLISMALTMTSYFRDSDTVLAERPPLTWQVDVNAPPASDSGWSSWAKDLWQRVTSAVNGLGGLAVSVSAIAAVIAMVVRRRLPSGDADASGDTEPVGDDRRRQ
ncbi:hypothetical protein [Streptomyces sp. T21Q-yed]|nr:hypothetical protein [Streptomyces sp. T21Q-yed]